MADLAALHLLRPLWLLGVPLAIAIWWSLTRARSSARVWRGVVAPHLLGHLLVEHGRQSSGPAPTTVLLIVWLLGLVAAAGPAWQRQPTPFSQDQAALVIALKVTPEMLATDVQPSRLARGVQKIRDLLDARAGARTAFIAYAGSAHLVMPLTTDPEIIATFAADLDPEIMPRVGDAAGDAVAQGNRLLARAGVIGSILLVADTISEDQVATLEAARRSGGADVHVLAVAADGGGTSGSEALSAPPLDRSAMAAAARAGGGALRVVSVDDTDVRALTADIATSLARAPAQDGERWRDDGYLLLPLMALLMLLLFRRGAVAALD